MTLSEGVSVTKGGQDRHVGTTLTSAWTRVFVETSTKYAQILMVLSIAHVERGICREAVVFVKVSIGIVVLTYHFIDLSGLNAICRMVKIM